MRLEAEIKMGYYPTPLSVVERVRSSLRFPEDNANLLDPRCGEGLALRGLKGDAKATTYGIELDECKAEEAKTNLDHVIKGDYEDARISNNVFSCLFLNPPYDWGIPDDEGNERKEKTFLRGTVRHLQPSGTLVYIMSQKRLSRCAHVGRSRLFQARAGGFSFCAQRKSSSGKDQGRGGA